MVLTLGLLRILGGSGRDSLRGKFCFETVIASWLWKKVWCIGGNWGRHVCGGPRSRLNAFTGGHLGGMQFSSIKFFRPQILVFATSGRNALFGGVWGILRPFWDPISLMMRCLVDCSKVCARCRRAVRLVSQWMTMVKSSVDIVNCEWSRSKSSILWEDHLSFHMSPAVASLLKCVVLHGTWCMVHEHHYPSLSGGNAVCYKYWNLTTICESEILQCWGLGARGVYMRLWPHKGILTLTPLRWWGHLLLDWIDEPSSHTDVWREVRCFGLTY